MTQEKLTNKVEEPVTEAKVKIAKIEYKLADRMEKIIECRVIQSTYPVTKGYSERRKRPVEQQAFGVDNTPDEIRNNIGLTIVQRDNIWTPYYEVKLEDDDLANKFRKNVEAKKVSSAIEGQEIEDIQQKLIQMDQAERDEKEKLLAKDQPPKPVKKTFDVKALMQKKAAEEEAAGNVKVEDPLAVKLTNVPGSVTEQDLRAALGKFGTIESCYIPQQDAQYSRSMKIAIVRYKHKDEATRAIQEQEVNIAFSMVQIERAFQKQKNERERGDRHQGDRPPFQGDRGKDSFSEIKRNK